jgi:hypothetical protein
LLILPDIPNGIKAEDDLVPESEREEEHSQKEESDEELQSEARVHNPPALQPRGPGSVSILETPGMSIIHFVFSHCYRE